MLNVAEQLVKTGLRDAGYVFVRSPSACCAVAARGHQHATSLVTIAMDETCASNSEVSSDMEDT